MKIKKALYAAGLVALFVAGLTIGGRVSAQDEVVADPVDVDLADTSGSWEFIRKVDNKCIDNGDMDFCKDNNPDLVCKLGIKTDRAGNVVEKKCQN